jgi:iron(III) transport system ATP-binding protein
MIRATGLGKRFGRVEALQDVTFVVPRGHLLTLLGPSGCGKTTTLRCVAGLERADQGEIVIGKSRVFSASERVFIPANRRKIGIVFQSYAIWPHMTVYGNVGYPLKQQKLGPGEERRRVERVLELVGLKEQIDRPAPFLSGGQQQRVAVARALVAEPEVLLLDEPLSNLDARLREEMRGEIRALQRRVGITALYVTHDQVEALAISDSIAVMSEGRIVERGAPRDLYDQPRSRFAAQFVGAANLVAVAEAAHADGMWTAMTPWGRVRLVGAPEPRPAYLLVRPEDIQPIVGGRPSADDDAIPNVWDARVVEAAFLGAYQRCRLRVGESDLIAHFPRHAAAQPGAHIRIHVPVDQCVPLA